MQVLTVLTLTFGPLLALTMDAGQPNAFDLVSPWSIFVTLGAIIGIIVFFVVFFLFTPILKQIVRLLGQMQQNPQQLPPSELPKLQKRLGLIPPIQRMTFAAF